MKEQLISFETAKLAKEEGFKEGSMSHYEEDGQIQHCRTSFTNGFMEDGETRFEAPTQSLLQKWLREVHNIHIAILPKILPSNEIKYYCFKGKMKKDFEDLYDTYEEALEIGLYRALELRALLIADVIKSLPSAIILAEKFAESKREHVVKCRIEKDSIANLGLYLGFIEGYNYVIEKLKG